MPVGTACGWVVSRVVDETWLRDRLTLATHPRSATYDPQWMVDNCMGPNPLWLLEDLARDLRLEPGMRVLDLGCGTAMTSVFLAKEYGVTVWAADLWVRPEENAPRIADAGVSNRVFPLHTEAHDLKFAPGFFDVIVSVDAYQYFGTDDLYIGYVTRFLRPGGQLGIAVPGTTKELTKVPRHLEPFWEWDFMAFHSVGWWRNRWELSGQVEVTSAREQQDGWRLWHRWSKACAQASDDDFVRKGSLRDIEMLATDAGQIFAFPLVVGRRPDR